MVFFRFADNNSSDFFSNFLRSFGMFSVFNSATRLISKRYKALAQRYKKLELLAPAEFIFENERKQRYMKQTTCVTMKEGKHVEYSDPILFAK